MEDARVGLRIVEPSGAVNRREVFREAKRLEQRHRQFLRLVCEHAEPRAAFGEMRERFLHARERTALVGDVRAVMGDVVVDERGRARNQRPGAELCRIQSR